ncbi:hypothetical protein P148_SR1C00001G1059 [candidate division SR1 bacterium RAAC1_SR1_1]|nr:hypothetical protein P148_SR1C00001G1059 [candidate division SR1 bacterium RAAC1_SR1_1]
MKTFAFSPTNSLKNGYENILIKYRNQDAFLDMLKIGSLLFVFLFCLFIYLRYVSLSSTYGYFLRKENQNLSNVSFQYEIYKTQILDQRQKNWTIVNSTRSQKRDVITVNAQIVTIPVVTELSMK